MTQIVNISEFGVDDTQLDGGRHVVAVRGAVDLFSAPELKRRLLDAIDGGARHVVLDLSETGFLDSTGLGALLTAHRRLASRDGRLVIVPGDQGVMRVFEITGLDSIFTFAPTREAALAPLSG